jgi:hypothetical protein
MEALKLWAWRGAAQSESSIVITSPIKAGFLNIRLSFHTKTRKDARRSVKIVLNRKYGYSKSNFPLFSRKELLPNCPLMTPLPCLESEKELGKPQFALTLTQISTPSDPCQEILIERESF